MIIFMGTPQFAVAVLQMLIDNNYPIGLVVTQPDSKVGRKQILTPSPVKELALKNNLKVFQPEKLKESYQTILDLKPTLLITAAYGQILPRGLLDNVRSFNLHGSLLPKYRGGAPIQHALFNDEKTTGVTLMEMVFKMDAGDMIAKAVVDINEDDDYYSLTNKLSLSAAELLKEWMPRLIANDYPKTKQLDSEVSFAYNIKANDEIIDWNLNTNLVLGKIRGLAPNLGAITFINLIPIKIFKAQKSGIIKDAIPGTIHLEKKRLAVKTKDGWIEVLTIQQQGKKQLDIISFLNGQTIIKDNDHFLIGGSKDE